MQNRRYSRTIGGLALTVVLCFFAAPAPCQTANYLVVNNVEENWVNLNLPPIRPMMFWNNAELYAVNTHDSTALRFTNASGSPTSTWRVPWGPVSIAGWTSPPTGPEQILVVCRGSYVLAFLDRITGQTLNVLELPAEPGDILVDQTTHEAYISCAAQDLVVEVDLVTATITNQWQIPGKNPLFMTFDGNLDVLVSPLFSGNNSGIHKLPGNFVGLDAEPRGILDFADPAIAAAPGLPDEDMFRIIRGTPTVQPVLRAMGTILFANGINPVTNRVWQLGTRANNKDPNKQTEPAIQGEPVDNILSIANLPGIGMTPNTPLTTIDLDDANPTMAGVQIDQSRTVGQPYGLSFDTATGVGFITGLLTDNITVLNQNGNFLGEFDVSPGSIPRSVLYLQPLNLVFVYCWGTNVIEAYNLTASPTLAQTYDLGFDPTPDLIKRGRQIYYSAFKSRDNNASCNACHVEGKGDNLAWNLSNEQKDNKGPMFTQHLAGIDIASPFHWRSERKGLISFNPAFTGLLGAHTALETRTGGDFEAFEAFVLSMRNPANPNTNEERVIDDNIHGPKFTTDQAGVPYPTGSATNGQLLFLFNNTLPCEGCHHFPLSTSNEVARDDLGNNNPKRQWFKVAPFHELYRKEMDADPTTADIQTVNVTFTDPTLPASANYPVTGFGFSHAGVKTNLHNFIQTLENPGLPTPLPLQQSVDLLDFAWQWDNGMGLAVHRAYLLDINTVATIGPKLTNYLEPQSFSQRNCDIAVYGTSTFNGTVTAINWAYDRTGMVFIPDDSTLSNQPLTFFINQATANEGANVFVGVPVGMGRRFGIDYDSDDMRNVDELNYSTPVDPYNKDTDGDRWWDGHEFNNASNPAISTIIPNDINPPTIDNARTQWYTSRVATLTVHTNEATAVTVNYMLHGGTLATATSSEPSRVHRIVLDDLKPSTAHPTNPVLNTYIGNITATDLGGLSTSVPLPAPTQSFYTALGLPQPITSRPFNASPEIMIMGDLRWTNLTINRTAGTVQGVVRARIDRKTGGPPTIQVPGAVGIFRVMRNGQPIAFTYSGATSFTVNGNAYAPPAFPRALTGPFLVTGLSDANGFVNFNFSASGFSQGDVMSLNLEFITIPVDATVSLTDMTGINLWAMPSNPAFNFPGDGRCLDVEF